MISFRFRHFNGFSQYVEIQTQFSISQVFLRAKKGRPLLEIAGIGLFLISFSLKKMFLKAGYHNECRKLILRSKSILKLSINLHYSVFYI